MATPRLRKQFRALCHEHHMEMRLTEIEVQGEGGPTRTSAYACPRPGCGIHYTPSNGYFIAAKQEQVELEIPPRVRCPFDGQAMYLAETDPKKSAFRLWRCPQCDWSRTNKEGLVDSIP